MQIQNISTTKYLIRDKNKGQGPAGLWLSELSHCLGCQHSTWGLVPVPAALFLVQLPANSLGNTAENDPRDWGPAAMQAPDVAHESWLCQYRSWPLWPCGK